MHPSAQWYVCPFAGPCAPKDVPAGSDGLHSGRALSLGSNGGGTALVDRMVGQQTHRAA